MVQHIAHPPVKRPKPLQRPKAGEALPAYGVKSYGSNSLRIGLRARERAVIDRALAILGTYMRTTNCLYDTPCTVKSYLRLQFEGEPVEHFGVLYLDSQHHGIAFERHFTGTLTQTSVHPREIVCAALRHGASAVVLAHNHPSDKTTPSRADEALTQTIKAALVLVDVRMLDHVIVGRGDALSMAEQGLI